MPLSFDPMPTTGFSGSFLQSTNGYIQGVMLDDPAIRYQLEGGQVDPNTVDIIWGGLPLTLSIPDINENQTGSYASIADSAAVINAWSVFNQASAMIITPASNVPTASAGMSINFARTGTNARLVLPVNPAALSGLANAAPNVALYWDFTNNWLAASGTGILPIQLEALSNESKTVYYNSGAGTYTWQLSGGSGAAGCVAVVRI